MGMYGLKNLTEVFEGKAYGVKTPVKEEDASGRIIGNILQGKVSNKVEISDNIDLKAKTSPRLKEKGASIEGKIFGKTKFNLSPMKANKPIKSLMSIKPRLDNNKINVSSMLGLKPKKHISSLMPIKSRTNINVRDVVQRGIQNTNIQRLTAVRGTESNLLWRMQQQRGLNMLGDFDRDGVPNILDCQPRNRWKQGPEDTGNMDDLPPPPPPPQAQPQQPSKLKQMWEGAITKAGRAVGILEPTPEEKARIDEERAFNREIERQARINALRTVFEAQNRQRYSTDMDKALRGLTAKQKARLLPHLSGFDKLERGYNYNESNPFSAGYAGFQAATEPAARIDKVYRGFAITGGGPGTLVRVADVRPTEPFSQKVTQTVGRQREQMEYGIPQTQQVITVPVTPPQYEVQEANYYEPQKKVRVVQPGKIYSPYSKRPVTYTRGPYTKHKIQAQFIPQ